MVMRASNGRVHADQAEIDIVAGRRPDAAGKTTLADELAWNLAGRPE